MNKKAKEQIECETAKFYHLRDFFYPFCILGVGIPFAVYSDYRIKKAEHLIEKNKNLTFSEYVLG